MSTLCRRRDLISSVLLSRVCRQGDANRSESDDEKKSDNFEEDEKVEQLRDTGKLTPGIVFHQDRQTNPADLFRPWQS